jgi:hypothetical protein
MTFSNIFEVPKQKLRTVNDREGFNLRGDRVFYHRFVSVVPGRETVTLAFIRPGRNFVHVAFVIVEQNDERNHFIGPFDQHLQQIGLRSGSTCQPLHRFGSLVPHRAQGRGSGLCSCCGLQCCLNSVTKSPDKSLRGILISLPFAIVHTTAFTARELPLLEALITEPAHPRFWSITRRTLTRMDAGAVGATPTMFARDTHPGREDAYGDGDMLRTRTSSVTTL